MRNLKFSKYPDIHAMKKDVDEYINNNELGIMSTMPDDYFDNIEFRTEGTNKLKYGYKNGFPYYISSETDIEAMQKAKTQGRYQSMYPETGSSIGDVVTATPEVIGAIPYGAAQGVDNAFKLIDSITGGAVTEIDNFFVENFPNTLGKKVEMETPEGIAGTTGTIIGQYVIPGAGVYKMARGALLLAEPLTVGLFSSKDEGNLANVIEDMFPDFTKSSELSKTLIEGLSVDADDTEIMARAKNIVADAIPFVAVEKFYKILKGLKQNPEALEELKSVGAAASPTTKPSEPVIMQGDTNLVKTNIPEEDFAKSDFDRIEYVEGEDRPFRVYNKNSDSYISFKTQEMAEENINANIKGNKRIREEKDFIRSTSPFYSNVEKAISNMTMKSGRGDQILATIKNTSGVKQSEIEDLGLDQFLAGKEKVTMEELNDFIADKSLTTRVTDTILGDPEKVSNKLVPKEGYNQEEGVMDFLDYANTFDNAVIQINNDEMLYNRFLEFLENKYGGRMVNDFLGEKLTETQMDNFYEEFLNDVVGVERGDPQITDTQYGDYTLEGGENYKEMLITVPDEGKPFIPQHFSGQVPDGEKLIAHARFNERIIDGKKTLFVEEIQSDIHQKGRKHGYKVDTPEIIDLKKRRDEIFNKRKDVLNEYNQLISENKIDQAKQLEDELKLLYESMQSHSQEINRLTGVVPDAPFKKNWHELTMKRLIKYAIDNGFDAISFTPGKIQADRYDLSKQVDNIIVSPLENDGDKIYVEAYSKNNLDQILGHKISPEKLDEYVGKDLADKIRTDISNNKSFEELKYSGLDLQVGGEGMEGFYDKMLPAYLSKFGKKYGAKLEEKDLYSGGKKSRHPGLRQIYSNEIEPNIMYQAVGNNDEVFAVYEIKKVNDYYQIIQTRNGKKNNIFESKQLYQTKDVLLDELEGYYVPQIQSIKKQDFKVPFMIFTPDMKKEILQEGVPIAQLEDKEQEQQTAVV